MINMIVAARNKLFHFFYTKLLKPALFGRDPELVHDAFIRVGQFLGKYALTRNISSLFFSYSHPALEQKMLNIHFSNPIGLSAGFDKDALLTDILPNIGFGFAEVGSITGEPCAGNAKPRLWRLPSLRSLVVYYGLKNEGCERIAERIRFKKFKIPIGTSIAKTNCVSTAQTEAGISDYVKSFREFSGVGDYFTINISCPNAFGGQPFIEPELLDRLLTAIDKEATLKPIFLKISPDIAEVQLDDILKVCERHRVQGFICSNLTKKRDHLNITDKDISEKAGLSGKVVEELSNAQIRRIYSSTRGKYVIIGCGGVFSASDAYKKIKAGASLVQLITGMIFEGPQLISEINRGLVKLLKKDGYDSIAEAIGAEFRTATTTAMSVRS